jgi:hypothetical protein
MHNVFQVELLIAMVLSYLLSDGQFLKDVYKSPTIVVNLLVPYKFVSCCFEYFFCPYYAHGKRSVLL